MKKSFHFHWLVKINIIPFEYLKLDGIIFCTILDIFLFNHILQICVSYVLYLTYLNHTSGQISKRTIPEHCFHIDYASFIPQPNKSSLIIIPHYSILIPNDASIQHHPTGQVCSIFKNYKNFILLQIIDSFGCHVKFFKLSNVFANPVIPQLLLY